jgi:hypothetical protein
MLNMECLNKKCCLSSPFTNTQFFQLWSLQQGVFIHAAPKTERGCVSRNLPLYSQVFDQWALRPSQLEGLHMSAGAETVSCGSACIIILGKGEGKFVPGLNEAPRHEDLLGEWRYSSTHS